MRKFYIGIGVGIIIWLIIFLLIKQATDTDTPQRSDYFIISNQIKHLNKMVVVEQDFNSINRTSFDYTILGKKVSSNAIVTVTQTNAQVSYDLNKMKIKVDSINRELVIEELPKAQIDIRPSVEIQSLDDSFLNRIDEEDIKKVTENAKKHAYESVNKSDLEAQGKQQLMKNLDQIFVLAKALDYKIIDDTKTLPLNAK